MAAITKLSTIAIPGRRYRLLNRIPFFNFIAKTRVFNFNAEPRVFNFNAKIRVFNFTAKTGV